MNVKNDKFNGGQSTHYVRNVEQVFFNKREKTLDYHATHDQTTLPASTPPLRLPASPSSLIPASIPPEMAKAQYRFRGKWGPSKRLRVSGYQKEKLSNGG